VVVTFRRKNPTEGTGIQGYYKKNRHFQCCNL